MLPLLEAGLPIRALAHLTGDGLFNLVRTVRAVGFDVERWPEVPPIFGLVLVICALLAGRMSHPLKIGVALALAFLAVETRFGGIDSLPPGTRKRFEAAGRAIAVFNADGTFYALRDICPHQGAALSGGKTSSSVRP